MKKMILILFFLLTSMSLPLGAQTFNEVETKQSKGSQINSTQLDFEEEEIDEEEYSEYNEGYSDSEEVLDGYEIEPMHGIAAQPAQDPGNLESPDAAETTPPQDEENKSRGLAGSEEPKPAPVSPRPTPREEIMDNPAL